MLRKYLIFLLLGGLLAIPVSGCVDDKVAQEGDVVRVDYTGTLSDGTVFDSSKGSDPLEFTIGDGELISGFEDAVKGLKVGQTKTVTIPADEAYGERRDDLILDFNRADLSTDLNPVVGDNLTLRTSNGQEMLVPVVAVNETTITVDANSPLAGKDLTFEIKLVALFRK